MNHIAGIFIHLCEFVEHSFETIGSKQRRLSNKMYKYSPLWFMQQLFLYLQQGLLAFTAERGAGAARQVLLRG